MRPWILPLFVAISGCAPPAPQTGMSREEIINSNRLTTNRLTTNRLTTNRLTTNALTGHQLTTSGLLSDALIAQAVTSSEVRPDGATEGEATRELLQYVYSCAMPEGTTMDLVVEGVSYGTLHGAIGLAPEWGEEGGSCGETCQRWISACLLARTNFWGVPVEISLRGNHPALVTAAEERAAYPLREGSYYGNIFVNGAFGYGGEALACGGPGSNVPQLTRRFCSSGADVCAIKAQHECVGPKDLVVPTFYDFDPIVQSCERMDPNDNTVLGCYDGYVSLDGEERFGHRFDEVITVFLKEPIAICGDGVCLGDETPATCRDCSAGWARDLGGLLRDAAMGMVVDGQGHTHVTVAVQDGADLGLGTIALAPQAFRLYLVTLDRGGRTTAAVPIAEGFVGVGSLYARPILDPSGDIFLAGYMAGTIQLGDEVMTAAPADDGWIGEDVFLARVSPSGERRWARRYGGGPNHFAVTATQTGAGEIVMGVMVGAAGVQGFDTGAELLYGTIFLMGASGDTGDLTWVKGMDQTTSLLDTDGMAGSSVAIATAEGFESTRIGRLDLEPSELRTIDVGETQESARVAATADGGWVATWTTTTYELKAARYTESGVLVWERHLSQQNDPSSMRVDAIDVNDAGEVLIAGTFYGMTAFGDDWLAPTGYVPRPIGSPGPGTGGGMGGGMAPPALYPDVYVVKLSPDGDQRWVRAMGSAGNDMVRDLVLDEEGTAYVAGDFTRTGLFDGRILENAFGNSVYVDMFVVAIPDPGTP
jgi:hypothetical protein